MTVKDFILSFDIDKLARIMTDDYINKDEEKATLDEVVKLLHKTFKSIEKLSIRVHNDTILHADKTYDEDEGYDYYDVCCSEVGDDTKYSVILVDWKDFLGYQLDESIAPDDIESVAAIVWELTWHGWTYRAHKKYRRKMERDLNRVTKKIKKGFRFILGWILNIT